MQVFEHWTATEACSDGSDCLLMPDHPQKAWQTNGMKLCCVIEAADFEEASAKYDEHLQEFAKAMESVTRLEKEGLSCGVSEQFRLHMKWEDTTEEEKQKRIEELRKHYESEPPTRK